MRISLCCLTILVLLFASADSGRAADRGTDAAPQVIILKLDDITKSGDLAPRWQRVTDFLEENHLKAAYGIIGYSLEDDNPAYFQWIKDLEASGRIEFWNHGYRNRTGADKAGEFEGSYEEQKEALLRTQRLAKEKLGIELKAFGPHWSHTNEATAKALEEIPGITMWFYGDSANSSKFIFKRVLTLENPTHVPNFERFKERYEQVARNEKCLALQGHPNSWDDERWENFVRIVEYLKAQGCVFMTPSEYVGQLKADSTPDLHTYVYKRVGDLEIKANVYEYDDTKIRPVVVWIHGGALIMGNRDGVSGKVRQFAFENGYVLVSIDYRLAPETKLPEIIADLEDAFRWLRREGPERFHIDPERIAVTGGSAGGYMTLTAGFRVKPRPRVLLSLWGYGDLVGDWYSQPSPHPRHQRSKLGREEAWQQVSGPPISDSRDRKGNGGAFYQYCRQTGTWPTAVSGWDPHTEAEKFYPFMAVKNVDKDYPPTAMIHGTDDTDVPHKQSVMMAEQFRKHGVEYELFSIKNAEHGLPGGDPAEIDAAYRRAFEFLKRHLEE